MARVSYALVDKELAEAIRAIGANCEDERRRIAALPPAERQRVEGALMVALTALALLRGFRDRLHQLEVST